jgi:hypothetical protein
VPQASGRSPMLISTASGNERPVDGAVIAANRALAARGYSPDEARVEPADDIAPGQCRLIGTMLTKVETDMPGRLLRLVSLMPERHVLAEARSQGNRD